MPDINSNFSIKSKLPTLGNIPQTTNGATEPSTSAQGSVSGAASNAKDSLALSAIGAAGPQSPADLKSRVQALLKMKDSGVSVKEVGNKAMEICTIDVENQIAGLSHDDLVPLAKDLETLDNWVHGVSSPSPLIEKSTIIRTPTDPNAWLDKGSATEALHAAADAALFKQEKEAKLLGNLSATEKETYQATMKLVGGDPKSQRALQKMLENKGSGQPLSADNKDFFAVLKQVNEAQIDPNLDRTYFLEEVLEDINDPTRINQKSKQTCTATTVQIMLAKQNPAEYLRLATELASPSGKTKLADGTSIQREPDWRSDDGGRTNTSRLMQPAFMEVGNGSGEYDNTADITTSSKYGKNQGLYIDQLADLTADVLKKKTSYVSSTRDGGSTSASKIIDDMKTYLKTTPVPLSLHTSKGGHAVLATKIENDKLFFTNPWGTEETIALSDLSNILNGAVFPS